MERLLLEMVNVGHTDWDDKVWGSRDILEREAYKLTKDFLNVTMKQHNKTKGE